jgi:hypothetical protein
MMLRLVMFSVSCGLLTASGLSTARRSFDYHDRVPYQWKAVCGLRNMTVNHSIYNTQRVFPLE